MGQDVASVPQTARNPTSGALPHANGAPHNLVGRCAGIAVLIGDCRHEVLAEDRLQVLLGVTRSSLDRIQPAQLCGEDRSDMLLGSRKEGIPVVLERVPGEPLGVEQILLGVLGQSIPAPQIVRWADVFQEPRVRVVVLLLTEQFDDMDLRPVWCGRYQRGRRC